LWLPHVRYVLRMLTISKQSSYVFETVESHFGVKEGVKVVKRPFALMEMTNLHPLQRKQKWMRIYQMLVKQ